MQFQPSDIDQEAAVMSQMPLPQVFHYFTVWLQIWYRSLQCGKIGFVRAVETFEGRWLERVYFMPTLRLPQGKLTFVISLKATEKTTIGGETEKPK